MEFFEYEKAIVKYNSRLNIKALPLISWDFFSQSFKLKQEIIFDNSSLIKLEQKNNWNVKWDYNLKLQNDTVIVVTDSKLSIVFASNNIVKMNGYKPDEVLGKNPKMFQGKETDELISKEIRLAIKNQQSFDKVILNYCKDGTVYKCHIQGYPVFDRKGVLKNFIAFEKIAA